MKTATGSTHGNPHTVTLAPHLLPFRAPIRAQRFNPIQGPHTVPTRPACAPPQRNLTPCRGPALGCVYNMNTASRYSVPGLLQPWDGFGPHPVRWLLHLGVWVWRVSGSMGSLCVFEDAAEHSGVVCGVWVWPPVTGLRVDHLTHSQISTLRQWKTCRFAGFCAHSWICVAHFEVRFAQPWRFVWLAVCVCMFCVTSVLLQR